MQLHTAIQQIHLANIGINVQVALDRYCKKTLQELQTLNFLFSYINCIYYF